MGIAMPMEMRALIVLRSTRVMPVGDLKFKSVELRFVRWVKVKNPPNCC